MDKQTKGLLSPSDRDFIKKSIYKNFDFLSEFYEAAYAKMKLIPKGKNDYIPSDVQTVKDTFKKVFERKRRLSPFYWKVLASLAFINRDDLPSRTLSKEIKPDGVKKESSQDNKTNQILGAAKDQMATPDYTSTEGLIGGRYMRRGSNNYNRGNYKSALTDYDKVVDLLPSSPLAYYNRCQIKCRLEDWAGALTDMKKVTELDPDAALPYCICFGLLNILEDINGSLQMVNKVIELEPGNALAFMYRSFINNKMGNFDGANADKRMAIKLDAELAGKIFIGNYYLPSIRLEHGVRGHKSGAESRTKYKDFKVCNRATLFVCPPKSNKNETDNLDKKIKRRPKDALADVNKAIKLNPSQSDNYIVRARIKANVSDLRGAIADMDLAILHQPDNDQHYYNRYVYKRQSGDNDGALKDLSKAIEFNTTNADYYNFRASNRAENGDLTGALDDATRFIDFCPHYAPGFSNRASIEIAIGNIDRAIADYSSAIERDRHYVLAYCNRGVLKLKKEDMDGALEDFNNAIRFGPRCPAGYYYRAAHSQITGSMDIAIDNYVKAYILLSPHDKISIQDILDRSYKHPVNALAEYGKAIEADPKDCNAYFIRGHLRDIMGDKKNAVEDLKTAFDIKNNSDPNNFFEDNQGFEGPIKIQAAGFT
jgi:tetratricopeptide (TPR) repeat protein